MNDDDPGSGPGDFPGNVPELPLLPEGERRLGRGWTITAALLGIIAVVAVAVGVANLRSDGGTDTADDGHRDNQTAPTIDLSPAGPRDGLDSLRLPISVEPSTGLVDGQSVTVSGSQFPPNQALGVVMCSGLVNHGGGSAQCQLSPYTPVQSDSEGSFTVEHTMRRMIVVAGEVIDCATPVPEGAQSPQGESLPSTCVVAVGAIADYDQSGVAPVGFDDTAPPPESPSLSVTPSEGLVDGDLVTVTVTGTASDWSWWPNVCTSFDPAQLRVAPPGEDDGEFGPQTGDYGGESWCEPLGGSWPEGEPSSEPVQLPVSRWFGALTGIEPIDCGSEPGRCWIEAYLGPWPAPPVPLVFDPSVPAGPPPTMPYFDPPRPGITETTFVSGMP